MKRYILQVFVGLISFSIAVGIMASQGYLASAYHTVKTALTPVSPPPPKHAPDMILAFREFARSQTSAQYFESWSMHNSDVRMVSKPLPSTKEGYDIKTIYYYFGKNFHNTEEHLRVAVEYRLSETSQRHEYIIYDWNMDGSIKEHRDAEMVPQLQIEYDQALDYLASLSGSSG